MRLIVDIPDELLQPIIQQSLVNPGLTIQQEFIAALILYKKCCDEVSKDGVIIAVKTTDYHFDKIKKGIVMSRQAVAVPASPRDTDDF